MANSRREFKAYGFSCSLMLSDVYDNRKQWVIGSMSSPPLGPVMHMVKYRDFITEALLEQFRLNLFELEENTNGTKRTED